MQAKPSTPSPTITLYEVGGILSAAMLAGLVYLGQPANPSTGPLLLALWAVWMVSTVLGLVMWLAAGRTAPTVNKDVFGSDAGNASYCIPPRRAPGVPDNHHAPSKSDPRYARYAKQLETDREINRAIIDWEPLAYNLASHKPVFGMTSDDVYGALLCAISIAAQKWKPSRSSFYSLARVCVSNRLIDLIRSAQIAIRHRNEMESIRLGFVLSRGHKNNGEFNVSLVYTTAEHELMRRTNED